MNHDESLFEDFDPTLGGVAPFIAMRGSLIQSGFPEDAATEIVRNISTTIVEQARHQTKMAERDIAIINAFASGHDPREILKEGE